MAGILGWVTRWRVAVLIVTLPLSIVVQTLPVVSRSLLLDLAFNVLLPFGLILWSLPLVRTVRSVTLVACPSASAFVPAPTPGPVVGAAGYTFLGARTVGSLSRDLTAGDDLWFSLVGTVAWGLLLIVVWRAALAPAGLRLRPDGIVHRRMLSSLFVPWPALAGPFPAFAYQSDRVTLVLADPSLIRRRGHAAGIPAVWPGGAAAVHATGETAVLPAAGVDAELLARAIHEYTNRPDLRPAVGTEAELARLLAIPQIRALLNPA